MRDEMIDIEEDLDELDSEEENDSKKDFSNTVSTTKKGITFMSKTVLFSIAIVIIYTIWTQVAAIVWKVEPNDTLTEWVYKFFGLEVALMCLKRILDKRLEHKKTQKK